MDALYTAGLFAGKVALVTGGGTGIGFAVAREIGQLGGAVAICGRRKEPLELAKLELEREGIRVFADCCDIRERDAVDAFVGRVRDGLGEIDILVNNAGGQFPTTAQSLSSKGFEAVVRNNLFGTWNMTQSVALQSLIPRKSGHIVNVIAQIRRGFPGMVHTGAARAGVENMTKTLAVEWACHGLNINAVAPGVIETSGTKQYPPELLETSKKITPLKRLGTPEEVAHLIVYLCSTASSFVTGQTFYIDGGQSLWGDMWQIGA